jgi:glycerol-3-phosphate acyltransferase PlsY
VLGTRWSVWIRGAGGRGNTLGVAALLVLAWSAVAISLAVWVATRLLTRNSFLATRIWILTLPVALGLVMNSTPFIVMGAALGLLYLSGHKTGTDDHTLLKENWPNLWAFITAPRRVRRSPKCKS